MALPSLGGRSRAMIVTLWPFERRIEAVARPVILYYLSVLRAIHLTFKQDTTHDEKRKWGNVSCIGMDSVPSAKDGDFSHSTSLYNLSLKRSPDLGKSIGVCVYVQSLVVAGSEVMPSLIAGCRVCRLRADRLRGAPSLLLKASQYQNQVKTKV